MKLFATFILTIFYSYCFSQNLLVNGGFEDENICTEYHVNCAPEGWISTGNTYNNFFKVPGVAHSGQHCVAIEAGNSRIRYMRTYVRTQLLCKLRKGNTYLLQFYVKSRHNILDSIGVFFTPYDFLFEKQVRQRIVPSMYITESNKLPPKNDSNWHKITMEYVANGKEVFMTFGNFSRRDITGETGIPYENHFYVLFDDVSLVPEDPKERLCDNWRKTREEIYEFDARHEFLEKFVKTYFNRPPDPPVIDRTISQSVDTLILPDIFFETAKSDLTRISHKLLDSLCNSLLSRVIDSVVVEGHTDSIGSIPYNKKLSEDRSESVANYIANNLLLPKRLFITRGWASEKPVAENKTAIGRQRNRRVEIFIFIRQ